MVSNDQFKVLGEAQTLIKYSKHALPDVTRNLYPKELEADIDRYIGWFYGKMRPLTQRMIRMILLPKI
jgi:hypothetical protein